MFFSISQIFFPFYGNLSLREEAKLLLGKPRGALGTYLLSAAYVRVHVIGS